MTKKDRRDLDIKALRDRLSRLRDASLRISESLDMDTVLQEVLDSARELTEGRYGAIVLLDDTGMIEDFLSSGLSVEEANGMWSMPDAIRFLDYLGRIEDPLRVPDFICHLREQGLPELRSSSVGAFLGAPIRRGSQRVGNIFLARDKGGQEFCSEDEETLVMFASQAALVIANASRYRDELQARSHLETLIETSPIGVVVFDAQTGGLVSFNREAVRIVEDLIDPGRPLEEIIGVLTVRRADGREVSLQEFPLVETLSDAETIRAEEVVIAVPDGRSVAILLNVTPIRAHGGDVESVVVTMQDLTPLQETERLRAEFLAMVSHELRTPLTSIKGSVATLLDPGAGLNPTEIDHLYRIIDAQSERMRMLISDLLDVAHIETGALSVYPEPNDVAVVVNEARHSFLSSGGKHTMRVELAPELPWVMADRPRMVQILGNLLANAARHSPESSPIEVSATRDGVHVAVSVSDKGRGIPADSLPHLFRKFSQRQGEDRGDTGLGLAICKGIVEAHGGRIWAESDGPGLGARFTFTVPVVEEAGFISPVAPATRSSRQKRTEERICVLAVDDDPQALRYVRETLSNAGYLTVATGNAREVLRLVEESRPDLVLLDLVLPGVDGIEMMREIQEAYDIPVIFLSAYGQDQLVARAFDQGAADYVVKPFSPTELAARIRAALRRKMTPEPMLPYVLGDLTIDYAERRVTLGCQQVRLTYIEYRTLVELSLNAGRVLPYAHLLRRVWGVDEDGDVRPIRTVISTLRRRLEDETDNPTYIFTEPRVGYRMASGENQGQE
ncbi:MAG: response regulator [Chloroflexi bacterium]|nr:response regulator [Chloroflexota bacterium]